MIRHRDQLRRSIAKLREINWDLHEAWTSDDLHDLHWYPATFPPQLPRLLISLFSKTDDVVLDPFSGSGTTVLQAVKSRRVGLGIELNPVGHMIAAAKLVPMAPAKLAATLGAVRAQLHTDLPFAALISGTSNSDSQFAPSAKVRAWYQSETLRELTAVWRYCQSSADDIRPILHCLFSSILKSACGQREHWGYIADNMKPTESPYRPATSLFLAALERAERQFALHAEALSPWSAYRRLVKSSHLFNTDIASAPLSPDSVDLVVTSPPYAGITDYARAHRLTFDWFGWSMDAVAADEIGARWKRFRKGAVPQYLKDMDRAASQIASWLRPNGMCVYVIGQSRGRDADHAVSQTIVEQLAAVGLQMITKPILRSRSRQRVVNRRAEPSEEAIYVFRKA